MTQFSHGFEPGGIPDFLSNLPGGLDGCWVLVPRLDSAPVEQSAALAEVVSRFADAVEWTLAGLLLPGDGAARVVQGNKLFFGFDEVVVFEEKPGDLARFRWSRGATSTAIAVIDARHLAASTLRPPSIALFL